MALPAPQVNVVGFGYEHYCYGDDKSATLYLPHNSSKMLAQPDTNIHGQKSPICQNGPFGCFGKRHNKYITKKHILALSRQENKCSCKL
jgi:hypothetical protein